MKIISPLYRLHRAFNIASQDVLSTLSNASTLSCMSSTIKIRASMLISCAYVL